MRFRNQLIATFLIQGLGALSIFIATVGLGWRYGPEIQGVFSRTKSELEFVSATALFGMPQAVFYFANSHRLTRSRSLWITIGVSAIALLAAISYRIFEGDAGLSDLALFSVAAAAMVAHAILRVLVLAGRSAPVFNAVTAAPQVMILGTVLLIAAAGAASPASVGLVFAPSYVAATWLAAQVLSGVPPPVAITAEDGAGFRQLFGYGAAAWSVSMMSTGATVLWLRTAEASVGAVGLGVFAMGLTIVQVALTPFNYAAPLLFKRWMDCPPDSTMLRHVAPVALTLITVLVAILFLVQYSTLSATLGSYVVLYQMRWEILLLVVAELAIRLVAVAANARGRPWAQGLGEFARLSVLLIAIMEGVPHHLEGIVQVWSGGACCAAVALSGVEWTLSRRRRALAA